MKITKSLSWRGSARLWTNQYHLTNGAPTTTGQWNALFDAIVAAEKTCLFPTTTIVQADGYPASSAIPAATKTYTTVGTLTSAGYIQERQVAALVRYVTAAKTKRNHPIYLFNYYHGISATADTTGEVYSTVLSALNAYATSWLAGFSDGVTTHARAGPNGAAAVSGACQLYLTHRDFPRR